MQRRGSAFNGFTIEATDGCVGHISDVLFDDKTMTLRWFVVNTGPFGSVRKILMHPSAMGSPDNLGKAFSVTQARVQVNASPGRETDEPVSRQMTNKPDYSYGPIRGAGYYGGEGMVLPWDAWQSFDGTNAQTAATEGDPHLRSIAEVKGYHIRALDGQVGHLTDFLIDDESWTIEFALVDTRNWWAGKHVLLPASAIAEVNWLERYLRVDLTCYKIKSGQPWTEPSWSHSPDL